MKNQNSCFLASSGIVKFYKPFLNQLFCCSAYNNLVLKHDSKKYLTIRYLMLFIFVYFYFLEESLDIKRCMDMFTYEYFYLLNPGE